MELTALAGSPAGPDGSQAPGKNKTSKFSALLARAGERASGAAAQAAAADTKPLALHSRRTVDQLLAHRADNHDQLPEDVDKAARADNHDQLPEDADKAASVVPGTAEKNSLARATAKSDGVSASPFGSGIVDAGHGNPTGDGLKLVKDGLPNDKGENERRLNPDAKPVRSIESDVAGLPVSGEDAVTAVNEPSGKKGLHKDALINEGVTERKERDPLNVGGTVGSLQMIASVAAMQLPAATQDVAKSAKGQVLGGVRMTDSSTRVTPEEAGAMVAPGVPASQGAFGAARMEAAVDKALASASAAPVVPYEVAVPVGQQGWSNAISKTVVNMLKDGVTQAMVSINPEHLGPVDIKISMSKGVVDVDFYSPHSEVREALAKGGDQLQARFAEVGVKLEKVQSHDTLPVMKDDFAQDRNSKDGQGSRQQEQRRESREGNSWLTDALGDELDV